MASGYNIYRGVGDQSNVDYDTPVASVASGVTAPSLAGLGHVASTRYTYAVRPYIDAIETPDFSAVVEFVTDGAGDWLGNRPAPVERVTVEALSGAQIKISWSYKSGSTAAADFGVYYQTTVPITTGTPDATVTYTKDGRYSTTVSLVNGNTYYATVTARTTAGAIESQAANTAGPIVADSDAPTVPTVYLDQVF